MPTSVIDGTNHESIPFPGEMLEVIERTNIEIQRLFFEKTLPGLS